MVMMPGGSPISSVPSMSKLTRVRVVSPPVGRTIAILARDGERVQGARRPSFSAAVPAKGLSWRGADLYAVRPRRDDSVDRGRRGVDHAGHHLRPLLLVPRLLRGAGGGVRMVPRRD